MNPDISCRDIKSYLSRGLLRKELQDPTYGDPMDLILRGEGHHIYGLAEFLSTITNDTTYKA